MISRAKPNILEIKDIHKGFAVPSIFGASKRVEVLQGISLNVPAGGAVGLVGESGSGKSTLARCILGLEQPDQGEIYFDDQLITGSAKRRANDGQIQPIFQNPASSLNPRRSIGAIIAEPLVVHTKLTARDREAEVRRLLDLVALPVAFADFMPSRLSGGQRQRVSIARALALRPKMMVADEATSALDVLVQKQIVDLLADLRAEFQMAILFVSHNLAVTQMICEEVAVMYKGRLVEQGDSQDILLNPTHEYTRSLVNSVPRLLTKGLESDG